MPDDEKPNPEPEPQPQPQPEPEPHPAPEPEPHPLEPGGKRFSEVYRDMQDARREAAELRERMARLEGQQAKPKPAEPAFYTPQQLQAMVEAGQINQAVATDQLAWQRAELAKREIRQELTAESRVQAASSEVQQYLSRVPKLNDHASDEFQKVRASAWEISQEMGLGVEDPRVQRRALREVLGSLDRIAQVKQTAENSRRNADIYAETGGGGGALSKPKGPDPLKDVPKVYMEHWQRLGYTRDEMVEEAKYVKPHLAAKYGRR